MKHHLNIFFLLLFSCFPLISRAYEKSAVELSIHSISRDSIYINVTNPTGDTLFLFDSYFDCTESPYLHRYRKIQNKKAAFLALWPMVKVAGWRGSDRINLNVDKTISAGAVPYHFITLFPTSTTIIALPLKCLLADKFYKDVKHMHTLSWRDIRSDDIREDFRHRPIQCKFPTICIELGIYNNIDWYTGNTACRSYMIPIVSVDWGDRPRIITAEEFQDFTAKVCDFRLAYLCVDLGESFDAISECKLP